MLENKPYFTVAVDTAGCRYDIRINDVPVVSDRNGFPVTVDIPVNHWMQSGENELSMHLHPLPKHEGLSRDTECSATLKVRESGTSVELNQSVASVSFSGNELESGTGAGGSSPSGQFDHRSAFTADSGGAVFVDEVNVEPTDDKQGIKVSRSITLPLPFPRWSWFDSDVIPDSEEIRTELVTQYQRIWDAAQSKRVEDLMLFFLERSRELAAAFYRTTDEMQGRIGLKETSEDPELELFGLYPDDTLLEVFGGGRLARLTSWDGEAAIGFNYVDGSGSTDFDFVFRKSGDKWIITR